MAPRRTALLRPLSQSAPLLSICAATVHGALSPLCSTAVSLSSPSSVRRQGWLGLANGGVSILSVVGAGGGGGAPLLLIHLLPRPGASCWAAQARATVAALRKAVTSASVPGNGTRGGVAGDFLTPGARYLLESETGKR
jgi:hypothetical protein